MKQFIISLLLLFGSMDLYSQHIYNAVIKDRKTNIPIIGVRVSVAGANNTASSDANGTVMLTGIPDGKQAIAFSYPGYAGKTDSLVFPLQADEIREIFLIELFEEMEEVVITSTRSSRTIENIPARVEFIAAEELDEKGNMKPGDIRMMLSESTGIQTQQTSATSANSSIRIQGLDGRYTQILKDGFPLYTGAASGLGLLQTPPLDLKQVEIIKGSASTLYGGGAIAGLVNLISKTPADQRDLRLYINGTSASGLDVSGFYGHKLNSKAGLTLFASRNSNAPYDPAGIDLTAIPKFERYAFNPKLFLYLNERTTLDLGVNSSFENRVGGDIHYIKGEFSPSHTYFEKNDTKRISSQLAFQTRLSERGQITVRSSYSFFDRVISIPGYVFSGVQNSTFTEGNYSYNGEISEWVAGFNLLTDGFKEEVSGLRNYRQVTGGVFIQNTLKASPWLDIETGLRADRVREYGSVLLPRFSALLKFNEKLSSRFGEGWAIKRPQCSPKKANGSSIKMYYRLAPVSINWRKVTG